MLSDLEAALGYTYRNKELLRMALDRGAPDNVTVLRLSRG